MPFSTLGWHNPEFVERGYATGAAEGVTIADLGSHADWENWFPADWVSEMREQIRLWFYSMLFMSVVLVGKSPYRRVLCYEKVNDETGRPMHKSWGNAIWFDDAVEKMGADVMRWMFAAQTPSQNLSFGYGPANEVKRNLLTLWNTYNFFVMYANLDGFEPRYEMLATGPDPAIASPLDRWMRALTQSLVAECRAALDSYDSPRLVRAVEAFVEDLSNWYVRASRQRFWKSGDADDKRAAYETLWYALVQLLRCVAPVMPFLADDLWQNLVRGACAERTRERAPLLVPRGEGGPGRRRADGRDGERARGGAARASGSQRRRCEAAPAACGGDRRHRRRHPARPRRPSRRSDRRRAGSEGGASGDVGGGVRRGRGDAAAEGAGPALRSRPGHDPRPSARG